MPPSNAEGADSEFVGVLSSHEIEELHVLEIFLRPRRARLGGAVIDNYKKYGHLYFVSGQSSLHRDKLGGGEDPDNFEIRPQ